MIVRSPLSVLACTLHACPLDLCGAKETPTTRQLITGARILRMRTRGGHRDKAVHPEGHTNNMTLYMYSACQHKRPNWNNGMFMDTAQH